jgi:hypothetical protein
MLAREYHIGAWDLGKLAPEQIDWYLTDWAQRQKSAQDQA